MKPDLQPPPKAAMIRRRTLLSIVASLAMLIAFWDVQLLLGVAIDVAVVVVAVARPGWTSWVSGG